VCEISVLNHPIFCYLSYVNFTSFLRFTEETLVKVRKFHNEIKIIRDIKAVITD